MGLEILTQYSLTVDSTEQPIERPSDREEQEKFFGKAKINENQFIVLPKGEDIVDVKVGDPGPTSDINQFRESLTKFAHPRNLRETKLHRRRAAP